MKYLVAAIATLLLAKLIAIVTEPWVAAVFLVFTLLAIAGLAAERHTRDTIDPGFLIPGDFDAPPEPVADEIQIRRQAPYRAIGRVPR